MTRTAAWRLSGAAIVLLFGGLSVFSTACWATDPPRISLTAKTADQPATFEVVGLAADELKRLAALESDDPAFAKIFTVLVAGTTTDPSLPPVGGAYRIDGSRLLFTPRYPPVPGLKYRAVLRLSGNAGQAGPPIEQELALPKVSQPDTKAARVEQIYPTTDLLPENHLRFYIQFSQPIGRGEAYQHLELLDAAGKPVDSAFLELGEELWDPSGRRFTLLLDPGRIKQGLKPREELGPILHQGKKYTLVVKRDWRDVQGQPLSAETRKSFSVGPAIDEPIDVKRWKITGPRTGTSELLIVRFPRPLDRALLERTITVINAAGETVAGSVTVADAERRWEFIPDAPWSSSSHQLVVDTVLEDTAGNSISRAFEVDEQHPITNTVTTETVKIPIAMTSDKLGRIAK